MSSSAVANVRCWRAVLVLACGLLGPACTVASQDVPAPTPEALARLWDSERLDLPVPPLVTHDLVEAQVARAVRESGGLITSEVIGRSVEGRAIHHLTVGRGSKAVLLWSQMHGDEPTATSALFDLCHWLTAHRTDPVVVRLLDSLTLHIVPMLNPDGAQRFQRRNAQGIDINRDALLLQTPEGQTLKALLQKRGPLDLPPLSLVQVWHPRYDADGAHAWLRSVVREVVADVVGESAA